MVSGFRSVRSYFLVSLDYPLVSAPNNPNIPSIPSPAIDTLDIHFEETDTTDGADSLGN